MARIKILKPNLTVLGKVREVGEIVNDPDPNECHNLVGDSRASYISDKEDAAEQAKEDAEAEAAAKIAADEAKLEADKKAAGSTQKPA